jgi:hypothetical protein
MYTQLTVDTGITVDYEAEAVFVNMPSCHDMYEFKAL